MVIDTVQVREAIASNLHEAAETFSNLTLLDVGVALITVGGILALNEVWKSWRKKRGYRMVLRERKDKIDRLLSDIITDGLLTAETNGEISNQEANAKYAELASKLSLPDLIPPKRRAQIVKAEIKGRINRERLAKLGKDEKDKFVPITGKKPPFRERIGTFANQFWRSKTTV